MSEPNIKQRVGVFVLFAAVAAVVYSNAIENPFHYDDFHSIQYNPHIRTLEQVDRFVLDPQTFSSQPNGYMFRPLTSLSLALNYAFHGQDVWGYRVVNLVLHIVCAFGVFLLVGEIASKGLGVATGLAFLLHPVHAELVNYLSSRSDLLVSCFYIFGFVLLTRSVVRCSIIGCVVFTAGLLCKSVAITLLMIVFAWESSRQGVLRLVLAIGGRWNKYWALSLLSVLYLAVIWGNRYVESSIDKMPRSLDVQLLTQIKALVYYLWISAVPIRLNVEHQFFESRNLVEPAVLLPGLFVLSLFVVFAAIQNRLTKFGLWWFLIALLPASLVPLNILVSERRMYLSSMGLVLLLTWAWYLLFRTRPVPALVVGVAVCTLFSVLTFQRNEVWADEVSLWRDSVHKSPMMVRSRLNLAIAYHKQERLESSLKELDTGLKLDAGFAEGWVLKGNILSQLGKEGLAEEAYREALRHNPRLPGVHHNIGNLYMSANKPNDALKAFQAALEIDPHFVKARNNLGQALESLGEFKAAHAAYELAVADSFYWPEPQDPELGGAWLNLARLSEWKGERHRAHVAFDKAAFLLSRDPKYAEFVDKARVGVTRTAAP